MKVRKHIGWANAVLLALLTDKERRGVGPLFLRACSLPSPTRAARGDSLKSHAWQTYNHERFGDADIRYALRSGYITVEPNKRAAVGAGSSTFVWGKQCGIRIATTELGRASWSAYVLRGGVIPFPERLSTL